MVDWGKSEREMLDEAYGKDKYILTDLKAKLKADREKWDKNSISYEYNAKCLGAMTEIDEILEWIERYTEE